MGLTASGVLHTIIFYAVPTVQMGTIPSQPGTDNGIVFYSSLSNQLLDFLLSFTCTTTNHASVTKAGCPLPDKAESGHKGPVPRALQHCAPDSQFSPWVLFTLPFLQFSLLISYWSDLIKYKSPHDTFRLEPFTGFLRWRGNSNFLAIVLWNLYFLHSLLKFCLLGAAASHFLSTGLSLFLLLYSLIEDFALHLLKSLSLHLKVLMSFKLQSSFDLL